MNNVLIIDDEIEICESIKLILEYENYSVEYSTGGEDGFSKLIANPPDTVLLDIQIGDANGFDLLQRIKKFNRFINVIMISAYGTIQNAIKATKLGAFDFLEKPIDRDKLLISVRNSCEQSQLIKENAEIKRTLHGTTQIIGDGPKTKKIKELISRVGEADVRVLITGENGTGKELVARSIHENSLRKEGPFVEVNCAAIPNELIESELFGHEKGSFTGAIQNRTGKFELANKGTLFLDEIGDMSLQAQAKVLRVIEEGKIMRVGGTKQISVDVRIISATNKNLKEEIQKGNFREDLYHRLNVIPVEVPTLRERREDIPALVNHFIKDVCEKHKKPLVVFAPDAIELLRNLSWPGNIRELRNIVERIIILVNKKEISRYDIDFLVPLEKIRIEDIIEETNSFQEFKEKAERAFILKQLEVNHWNISKTAEDLNIQRSHLYNKIKKYGIEKGE
ncbi:MAG: sigma-54-dependent Fis family transcriptional regulator [Ignavibacteriaceae bacterium]|nr:sigma-54-dependent Fis family transcriptional regulator [Ignavibacteriaceae bacterium]